MSNFVLVHGGWPGGWIWKTVARQLRKEGNDVYTPTLTGLADRKHLLHSDINLSTHIQEIVSLIEYEELNDVVLLRSLLRRHGHAVYFECLTPDGSHQHSKVVMVHGGNHTGSCYLNTLEDKPGWAYLFAEHGYEVLIPDWPGHGRSGALDLKTLTSEQTCEALAALISTVDGPVVLLAHSMGAAFGWRIAELCGNKIVAIVGIAPAPPGNIQPEPEILSESEEELVLRTQFRTLTLHNEGAALERVS